MAEVSKECLNDCINCILLNFEYLLFNLKPTILSPHQVH